MWCDILINIIGTVIGGLVLAAILFFFNQHTYITGEWDIVIKTIKSSYNPYKDLTLFFKFHLLQKGYEIWGSGEKIKEITSDGKTHEYERDKRVLSKISGHYERNILGADKIYLNIVENGKLRQTRTTYILTVKNKNTLIGSFSSTAADSKGQAKMTKS